MHNITSYSNSKHQIN